MSHDIDRFILDLWHPVQALEELPEGGSVATRLLGVDVVLSRAGNGGVSVRAGGRALPALVAYGYIWTSLGKPRPLFAIAEWDEPDRPFVHAATFGVNVSAPRAVENFLDMGHFPFVHTGILGEEPHTEVKEYRVATGEDGIVATECRFYQPNPFASRSGGAEIEYVYRVPHPYCAVLYKSSRDDPARRDVIALFLQTTDHERVRAHMLISMLDAASTNKDVRLGQQLIFAQDKPILENQYPRRLPLDPRAETPIRADKSAIAYRRWLSMKGVTFGVIPAPL